MGSLNEQDFELLVSFSNLSKSGCFSIGVHAPAIYAGICVFIGGR